MWPSFWWGFLQVEPVAPITLAGHKSEIFFFLRSCQGDFRIWREEVEGEELPWAAEAESRRDDSRQRRRQALCSWRCSAAAWWHCQEKMLVTLFTAGELLQRSSVTWVRVRRGLVTEQEPNPDLPLSVADSQWCPSFLQVVLTLFTVWADANLMMLQGEKWMVVCVVIVVLNSMNIPGFLDICSVNCIIKIVAA